MIFPFGSLYTNHFVLIFVSERSKEEIELVYVLDPQVHVKHIEAWRVCSMFLHLNSLEFKEATTSLIALVPSLKLIKQFSQDSEFYLIIFHL